MGRKLYAGTRGTAGVVSDSLRALLCVAVGVFVGVPLGVLFVPDPTGLVAAVAALAVSAAVAGLLYRRGAFAG